MDDVTSGFAMRPFVVHTRDVAASLGSATKPVAHSVERNWTMRFRSLPIRSVWTWWIFCSPGAAPPSASDVNARRASSARCATYGTAIQPGGEKQRWLTERASKKTCVRRAHAIRNFSTSFEAMWTNSYMRSRSGSRSAKANTPGIFEKGWIRRSLPC
jgi:hypothetical protein